jgi:hypothetical protein
MRCIDNYVETARLGACHDHVVEYFDVGVDANASGLSHANP